VNYFGQGALLLARPEALENPFFLMAPGWALYPLIALATAATIIASQAVISGAFSLTMQAGQLGYSPRLSIVHTSEHRFGQVYLPTVNWALFVAVVTLVLAFGSSSRLAGAYGIAVSTTMAVTTLLAALVARKVWGWPWVGAGLWRIVFLPIDVAFLGANLVKIHEGGWAPLGIGLIITVVMTTWRRGREILHRQLSKDALPLGLFLEELRESTLTRMPGAVVFMTSMEEGTPPGLFHYHRLVRALPERVVLVTVKKVFRPEVPANSRAITEDLNDGFYRVELRYGFRQKPSIPEDLEEAGVFEPDAQMSDITFVLGQESLSIGKKRTMARWRKRLFRRISKNATRPGAFFGIPTSQIMELGVGIEL